MALIVVLWALVLVSLLAAQVLGRTAQDVRTARSLVDRSAAELAADGAVRLAIASLLNPGDDRFEGDDPATVSIGGARVAVAAEDETWRVDLNVAPPELVEALLLALGVTAGEARRSAEMILASRAPGAGSAEHPAPFMMPSDLARVPGLPADLRRLMAPYVTTFTGTLPSTSSQLVPVRRALEMLEREHGGAALAERSWSSFELAFGARDGEPQLPERTVRITAAATGEFGARFTRTAVVAIRPDRQGDFRVLWWQRSWSGS